MRRNTLLSPPSERVEPIWLSALWLLLAAGLLAFSNGTLLIPVAAWIGPVFLLRFVRSQKPLPGLLLGYLVSVLVFFTQWHVAFQDAGKMFSLYSAVYALVFFLPYVIDRVLRPHLQGVVATLVFPVAWVGVEYLMHLGLPLATFFSVAYTQYQNLPFLQLMSVTGMWGITFMVIWFGSIVNYAWEAKFDFRRIRRGVILYAAILFAVVFLGGIRLVFFPPTNQTVRVAAMVTNVNKEVLPDSESPLYQRLVNGSLTVSDRQQMVQVMDEINSDLFERTRVLARGGSRIITWGEYNATTFKDQEADFLTQASQLAKDEGIYLVFPLISIQTDVIQRTRPEWVWENKSVMITPEESIAYQYIKHNLLVGPEMDNAVRGPRLIDSVASPLGRLGSVICLDMDYPDFMRLAGLQGVDIILSGAIDGTEASQGNPLHSIMASYRAIESGFSLARAGDYGQTVIVDYQGHILGSFNYYAAEDRSVSANVPIHGTATLYTRLGDFFPWCCLVLLAGLCVGLIIGSRVHKGIIAK
jgi:apolipoprotein N-acyltransferase